MCHFFKGGVVGEVDEVRDDALVEEIHPRVEAISEEEPLEDLHLDGYSEDQM